MTDPTANQRLQSVVLDEGSLASVSRDQEHERQVAIFDLLEDNSFTPEGAPGGPYDLRIALIDNRLALAKEMGATHLINSKTQDAKAAIEAIVGVTNLDVFIDNTGQPSIIELGYHITKPQGRVTLVGVPRKGNNINIYSLPLHFGKGLSGSQGGETIPNIDIARYQKLFQVGKIQLKQLITEIFTLEESNLAIDRMRSGQLAGRCLIKM